MPPISAGVPRAAGQTGTVLIAVGALLSTPVLAQDDPTAVFVNVDVTPMNTEQVLENQTVIVEGDGITAIGPVDDVSVGIMDQDTYRLTKVW
jgi:hypothetical protein